MQQRSEQIHWRNLIAAFSAVCVFSFSLGEIFPLLSLNMQKLGFSQATIGFNAAMAPIGILIAGLIVPKLAHLIGAKALATIMACIAAVIFLAYPTFPSLVPWFILRLSQGICVATLFALSEAWVVENAKGRWRSLIIGIYATCISATFGVGPAVIGWAGIDGYLPFAIGAAILLCAAIPISFVKVERHGEVQPHVSILQFAPKAPFLLLAIGVHAILDGGVLSFLPVYGVRMGMGIETAAVTLTALALGNVFFQIPLSWVVGRTSKAGAMIGCFVTVILVLSLVPFAIHTRFIWPLIVVLGAAGFGIYTVGLSELGDRFTGPDLVAGTSAFASVWGLGALIGSVICGEAMDIFGPNGLPGILIAVFVSYLAGRFIRYQRSGTRSASSR
ncbi:MAG TPA: MFS transporter [Terriglobia bacterium]|nr:MFS transporter [Terriglobia bacterium]